MIDFQVQMALNSYRPSTILLESEDAEWIDEDEVDTTGLDIPSSARASGLPFAEEIALELQWD